MAACVLYDGNRLQSGLELKDNRFSSASNKKICHYLLSNLFCATQKSEFMNDILGTFSI